MKDVGNRSDWCADQKWGNSVLRRGEGTMAYDFCGGKERSYEKIFIFEHTFLHLLPPLICINTP